MKKFVLLCGLMLSVMHISATDFTYNELNYSTVSENTCEVVSVSPGFDFRGNSCGGYLRWNRLQGGGRGSQGL